MPFRATYPTPEHATAAEAIVEFLTANYDVERRAPRQLVSARQGDPR